MQTLKERLEEFPFDMKALKKRFGKGVEYLGIIVHPHVNMRVYSFYQPKPNRALGHTEFFGLVYAYTSLYVMKLQGEEIESYMVHDAMKCNSCGDEIISLDRHDYQTCTCKRAMIDGGGIYTRMSVSPTCQLFKVNTLTKELVLTSSSL